MNTRAKRLVKRSQFFPEGFDVLMWEKGNSPKH